MIRVYLDWNAFSRLDDNDETYKKASAFLIDDSKYIIPFSHAHMLDLHRGYLKVGMEGIAGKLDTLQKYSRDLLITDTDGDELEFINIYVKKAMEMQVERKPIKTNLILLQKKEAQWPLEYLSKIFTISA